MKIGNTLLFTILLLASFSYEVKIRKMSMKNDISYPDNFFDGNWESTSYGCTDEQPTRVKMSTTTGIIEAIKLTDAVCVQKGHATLKLSAKATYHEAGSYPCDIILGYSGNPQSSSSDDCKIKIHDCNNYELKNTYFSLNFKRSEEFPDCKKAFQPVTQPAVIEDTNKCQVKKMITDLKSTDWSKSLNIEFINNTGKNVEIIWINYDGSEVSYNTLTNGQSYTQGTFATHPWVFKINNQAIGYYTADFSNEQTTQVFICMPEEEEIKKEDNSPPGLTTTKHESQDNCQVKKMITGLKSIEWSKPLDLKFINKTGKQVKIIWMDYQGNEVLYNTLRNTMFYNQQTYATHPWVFKIQDEAIGYYTPDFSNEQTTEVFIEDPETCGNAPAIIRNPVSEPEGQYPYPDEFFDGEWESKSYGCTDSQPTRVTMLTNDNGVVEAVKLTDAQCVQKGHVTLKFGGKPDYEIPGNYNCEIILGDAGNPQSSSSKDCTIEIVNCNYYKAIHPYFTLDFTRTSEIEFCDKAFPVEVEEEEDNAPPGPIGDDNTEIATEVWPNNFFEGWWKSNDYGCSETKETIFAIKTDYENDVVEAVRKTDSKCVNKGEVVFHFDARENYIAPGMYQCLFILGTEIKPQSTHTSDCKIKVINCNEFQMLTGTAHKRIFRNKKIEDCTPDIFTPKPVVDPIKVDPKPDPEPEIDTKPEVVEIENLLFPSSFLDGNWLTDDYGCTDVPTTEVAVHTTNDHFIIEALKLTPAKCVRQGKKTFSLPAQTHFEMPGDYPCRIVLGTKQDPESLHSDNCKFRINNCNSFTIKGFGLHFTRKIPIEDCRPESFPEPEVVEPEDPTIPMGTGGGNPNTDEEEEVINDDQITPDPEPEDDAEAHSQIDPDNYCEDSDEPDTDDEDIHIQPNPEPQPDPMPMPTPDDDKTSTETNSNASANGGEGQSVDINVPF